MCSTFKWILGGLILMESERDAGLLSRDITIAEADIVSHSPVTRDRIGATMPVATLAQGWGDCDTKSLLFASLVRSIDLAEVCFITMDDHLFAKGMNVMEFTKAVSNMNDHFCIKGSACEKRQEWKKAAGITKKGREVRNNVARPS